MGVSPKSLVLDLLATLGGKAAAPVRALVEAAALFGIPENNLRVALARLLSDGLVARDERGLYRLGPGSSAVRAQIRSWRQLDRAVRDWSGDWIAVHTTGLRGASAAARRRRARALRFLGFRSLAPGLEIRPENLREGVEGARARLRALGLEDEAPVFVLGGLDAEREALARALWDAHALESGYAAMRSRLEESAGRLARMPRDAAMVESFLLGGEALRELVLDPLLPEPIVDVAARNALVASMRRYDAIGRRAWAGWLGDPAQRPGACPVGVRGERDAAAVLDAATGG